MTACKDSLNGKKAVSATLAGVLAVGMVPAAAFAETAQADTTGEQGIDLLLNDQIEAFNNGSVTTTGLSKDADNTYYVEATGKAITNVTANSVYPKGSDEAITITGNEDYKVEFYAADENGKPTGSALDSVVDPGKYVLVVNAVDGYYKGGKATFNFTVKGTSLSTLYVGYLNEDGDAVDTSKADSPVLTYTAEAQDLGFATSSAAKATPLEEGTDYTVAYYNSGSDISDATKLSGAPVDAGTYIARVTGQGKYAGSTKDVVFTVSPLDLSASTIVKFAPITTTSASAPTKVEGMTVDGKDASSALTSQLKLTLGGSAVYYSANDSYTFKVVPADSANKNFATNSDKTFKPGTVTVEKVGKLATFKYGKSALAESYDLDKSAEGYAQFDPAKIKAYDGTTDVTASATTKYQTLADGKWGAETTTAPDFSKAGTYKVITTVATSDHKIGGSAETVVTVTEGTIDADASVYVAYGADKKIVTEVSKAYDGDAIAAGDFTLTAYDEKGALISNAGLTAKIYDADGEVVPSAKDAGTYTLKITSGEYNLTGTTELTITIDKLDLSTIKVNALEEWSNKTKILLTNNGGYEFAGLDLRYDTGKADSDKNDTASDAEGWDALPSAAGTLKAEYYDTEKAEWVAVADGQIGKEAGDYRITLTGTKDLAKNYTYDNDDYTTVVEFKAVDGSNLKFLDVTPNDWFFEVVAEAADAEIMNGYGNHLFGPNDKITRGQVACVLFNMAGDSVDENSNSYNEVYGYKSFDDVNGKMYYGEAIAWAKTAGIVHGYDDGTFRPDQTITREEFAAMLANFAQKFGVFEAPAADALAAMPDAGQVSSWAKESVAWAVENKIMGNGGVVNPGANITRAEVAAMTVNFFNAFAE